VLVNIVIGCVVLVNIVIGCVVLVNTVVGQWVRVCVIKNLENYYVLYMLLFYLF